MNNSEKHSTSHLKISVIGDAFVDIICSIDEIKTKNTETEKQEEQHNQASMSSIELDGRDISLSQPVQIMAGGSALNTATHLNSLSIRGHHNTLSVELQSVINETDSHGQLLVNHCRKYNLSFVNCISQESSRKPSTGHCVVLATKKERSFLTHVGCIGAFEAASLQMSRIISNDSISHVHISGFFNISGFWNGKLKRFLQQLKSQSKNLVYTSLVPQYDATEEWDGGLRDLLPLLDFLILNETEAQRISRSTDTLKMAQFYHSVSPSTFTVVTLGAKGVMILKDKSILLSQSVLPVKHVIDPTGAGDAFSAGFLYGLWNHLLQKQKQQQQDIVFHIEALKNGVQWGCAAAALNIQRIGASTPSSHQDLLEFLKKHGATS